MYNPLALIFCLLYLSNCVQSNDCGQDETLYCRGERALRNVIRNLNKSDKPLVIMPGMEIVPMHNESAVGKENPEETLLDSLANYLRTHEVNVKLVDLLEEGKLVEQASEARKKDKGQGLLLAMALMFGKMMAVLGLGGIGALAMKALGVAMVALMMAGMLGLKTAAQHGNESSHSISYVTGEGHHHKRRRRAAWQVVSEQQEQPLAYRAYIN
ncbi:uncharacterized protein Dwil_GK13035 [Drosophila willistoni]|uniref:Osiris 5 n=1 Tax=Drosophila willistoni TaxID=7260 RepID=B4NHD6_DROWI|nr:uncharacterized protein LOC124459751 [Drosophila willistoni]EDW84612.1 uncharacterized protein Dwil_GK13035 [Drosophila willistoni]